MKLRWGVVGCAQIATGRVIAAINQSERNEVVAIASRELATAEAARAKLGLARAYGSYAELVADPEIDAVYIP
ncbi:MAG TPA: Gfo/Idh/MocA family oxidoreductase, partial [Symbiobacteriaceae bacterium]|nr:Gfo/Idh/MocA family oxidoreductase [Symbiobacteriaceae bacterium]